MQLSLAMPKLRCKPMDHDGSPTVEHRTGPTATDTMLAFGRFRVLRRQRLLLADGVPVELGTRAFDILMVLLEADGALVTHNEMQSRVWPGIVVARDNLKVQISALRKALGEDRADRERPRLPLHRRGPRDRRRLGMIVNASRGKATEWSEHRFARGPLGDRVAINAYRSPFGRGAEAGRSGS